MIRRDFIKIGIVSCFGGFSAFEYSISQKLTVKKKAVEDLEKDIIKTSGGNLEITFIGHASVMFTFDNKVIYVDPWSLITDLSKLPKADIVLVTHEHMDHFDPAALDIINDENTTLFYSESCSERYKDGVVVHYGDIKTIRGIKIETVPAYNIVVKRRGSHQWGFANGYVITFGDTRIYAAGETEIVPEMKNLQDIDIAFFSVDSMFNMTPEMAAEAAKVIMPRILYPIHFKPTLFEGLSDLDKLKNLLKETKIEIRIRDMQ